MNLTITYKGIEFEVEYDYQPEEPMVRYYSDGSGYPGCAECIDGISSITHKGTDFLDFFEDEIEEIENVILETMHNQ